MSRKSSWIALAAVALTASSFVLAADKKPAGKVKTVGGDAAAAAPAEQKDTRELEGKAAPDFTFPVMGSDQKVTLSSLKGNVVLVDYWATWCPPCRASLPHVNELANDKELAAKGLKVFALNSKEAPEKPEKFVKENNYTFTVLLDQEGKFGKDYLVRGIPTSVIVGRDGTIKKVLIGFGGDRSVQALKKALDEALAEEPPAKAS